MKKKIVFLLCALLTVLCCFASCGDKEPEEKHFKDPDAAGTTATVQQTDLPTETAGVIDKELPPIPIGGVAG